jgi:hypothetical protein
MGAILLWLAWRRGWLKRPGALTGMFFVIYGLSRFAVEFVRQPDAQFAGPGNPVGFALQLSPSIGLTMGQILTLPMIALGLWLILRRARPRMTDAEDPPRPSAYRPPRSHDAGRVHDRVPAAPGSRLLHAQAIPLGRAGDFITAPEISQMFGELIGLWLAQVWMDQGAPGDAILLELGPGRGTLMADALRATRGVPGFHAAMEVHLVEASPHLREVQRQTLADHTPVFHDTLDTLPERPVFAIANEFFDALPIRQFQRAEGPFWHERVVGLDGDASPSASRRRRRSPPSNTASPTPPPA